MRRSSPLLLLSVLALTSLSCGSSDPPPKDACLKASDKLAMCGITSTATSGSGMQVSCAGTLLCNAGCISDASCDAIVDAFMPMTGPLSQAFLACTTKCANMP